MPYCYIRHQMFKFNINLPFPDLPTIFRIGQIVRNLVKCSTNKISAFETLVISRLKNIAYEGLQSHEEGCT